MSNPDPSSDLAAIPDKLYFRIGEVSSLVGVEPSRLSQYPIPWWVVIAVAIGVAKGAQVLGSAILGNMSWCLMAPVWLIMTRYIFGWMEKRRKHRAVLQLPDILDQVVRGARVGMPVLLYLDLRRDDELATATHVPEYERKPKPAE